MVEAVQVQLKKGVLELCVLALLSRGDAYGYEIASRLAEGIEMGEGTVYPLMRRMQADGLVATYLVESSSGPSRKYYRLTDVCVTACAACRREPSPTSSPTTRLISPRRKARGGTKRRSPPPWAIPAGWPGSCGQKRASGAGRPSAIHPPRSAPSSPCWAWGLSTCSS